jgi:hypothetical protein
MTTSSGLLRDDDDESARKEMGKSGANGKVPTRTWTGGDQGDCHGKQDNNGKKQSATSATAACSTTSGGPSGVHTQESTTPATGATRAELGGGPNRGAAAGEPPRGDEPAEVVQRATRVLVVRGSEVMIMRLPGEDVWQWPEGRAEKGEQHVPAALRALRTVRTWVTPRGGRSSWERRWSRMA